MPYYKKHVFICTNQRDNGKACCADSGAQPLFAYAKAKMQALGCHGKGQVRINMSGCLDRCNEGPALVIYPDGVWYQYKSQADIDEILDEHVINGRIVQRLLLDKSNT